MKKTILWILGLSLVLSLLPAVAFPAAAVEIENLCYDDYVDISGKKVEIVDAGKTPVISVQDNYLVATGIGDAQVRIDGKLHQITVRKAKINLIMIMGQSNAGNHFPNATSDVTCPIGTAYWWGNGQGTAATKPVSYTQPSMGFHTPLLAELYAQSVAAGDPVKNVMIWQEGITSKDGQPIEKWAQNEADTSGTDDAVTMLQNCIAYYKANSDCFEIVSSGVYWLQGESDITTDPALYTQRFLAMWKRLKDAGMEYLAFFRVRYLNFQSPSKEDLDYTPSLAAQTKMINENPDFYMASTITENWIGTPDTAHTIDISNYITMMETYGNQSVYTDQYGNYATYADGKLTTTMKTLYGSNNIGHYGKFGYGILGADGAYHMYRALHGEDVKIVVTDTSGHVECKKILTDGEQLHLDYEKLSEDMVFRAECGSASGTLDILVESGGRNITEAVTETGSHYGTISMQKLRSYPDVVITVTYTTEKGAVHKILCQRQGRVATWNVSDGWKVNFRLEVPEEMTSTAQVELETADGVQMLAVSALPQADGYYQVTVGITPAQLEKVISLRVINGNRAGAVFTCTPMAYLDTILANPAYEKYHQLTREMVNYGLSAQAYFYRDSQISGLADAALSDVPKTAAKPVVTGSCAVRFYGTSLVCREQLAMRCYFAGDVTGCTFRVRGETYSPVAKNGMHYVEIGNILPQDLQQPITVTVTDAQGNTYSVTDCPMNYVVRMYDTDGVLLQNLLKAIYNYHLAAKYI